VHEYGLQLESWEALPKSAAIVLAVAHGTYLAQPQAELLSKLQPNGCLIDVKSVMDASTLRHNGHRVWRL
jgi:UDP-N-acetyl-D-galactosamine dehydrogenase